MRYNAFRAVGANRPAVWPTSAGGSNKIRTAVQLAPDGGQATSGRRSG